QKDRAVHAHRGVAVGQRTGERRRETATVAVAVLESEVGRAVVLQPGADERKVHARVVRVLVGARVGVIHAVLQVGFDPRAGADATAKPAGGAPLDGVHRGIAGV